MASAWVPASWRAPALAFAVFALASVLLTFPVAWQASEAAAGDGADSQLFLWNHWWFAQALSEGQNPYATDAIYWPGGATLYFHTLSPVNALAATALAPVMGGVAAYNVLIIASFALAAWGAYLLARDLTRSEPAAYVAGAAFGFTSYHYAHALGHLNLVTHFWLPLFALFFLRYLRAPTRRDLLMSALMAVGAGWTDLSLLLNVALMAPLLAIGALVVWRDGAWRDLSWLRRAAMPGAAAAIGLAPLVILVVVGYLSTPGLGGFGDEAPRYSLDALSYAVPTPLLFLYGSVGVVLTPEGTTTEATVFAGFIVLALAAVGIARAPRVEARPWLVAGGIFYVLSLGPVLQVAGARLGVPLPYALFAHVPLLNTLRTPARFALVVLLALAVLAAFGAASLLRRFAEARPRRAYPIVAAIALLVALEGAVLPFPVSDVEPASIYDELALVPTTALVELPLHQPGYAGYAQNLAYLSAQTSHGIPIVNGYTSRESVRDTQFMKGEMVLASLHRLEQGGLPPEHADVVVGQDHLGIAGDLLHAWGLRALVLHVSDPPTGTELEELAFVRALPGIVERARTPDGVLFEARPTGNRSALLVDLGTGWHGLEASDGTPFRWTFARAQLRVEAAEPGRAELSLEAQPFLTWQVARRHVDLVVNDATVGTWTLEGGLETLSTTVELDAGTNWIELRSQEDAVSPIRLGIADDPRPLALSVRNVTLTPIS